MSFLLLLPSCPVIPFRCHVSCVRGRVCPLLPPSSPCRSLPVAVLGILGGIVGAGSSASESGGLGGGVRGIGCCWQYSMAALLYCCVRSCLGCVLASLILVIVSRVSATTSRARLQLCSSWSIAPREVFWCLCEGVTNLTTAWACGVGGGMVPPLPRGLELFVG